MMGKHTKVHHFFTDLGKITKFVLFYLARKNQNDCLFGIHVTIVSGSVHLKNLVKCIYTV